MLEIAVVFVLCCVIAYLVKAFISWLDELSAVRAYNWRKTAKYHQLYDEWRNGPMTQDNVNRLASIVDPPLLWGWLTAWTHGRVSTADHIN